MGQARPRPEDPATLLAAFLQLVLLAPTWLARNADVLRFPCQGTAKRLGAEAGRVKASFLEGLEGACFGSRLAIRRLWFLWPSAHARRESEELPPASLLRSEKTRVVVSDEGQVSATAASQHLSPGCSKGPLCHKVCVCVCCSLVRCLPDLVTRI